MSWLNGEKFERKDLGGDRDFLTKIRIEPRLSAIPNLSLSKIRVLDVPSSTGG